MAGIGSFCSFSASAGAGQFLLLSLHAHLISWFLATANPVWLTNGSAQVYNVGSYNVYDQCMARPAEESFSFHNRLAFYLGAEQFCPADGLLICFLGQLGPELALPNGLVAEPFYQMPNKKPNNVAYRCDKLRQKLEKEFGCGGDGKCAWKAAINNGSTGSWHGILLQTGGQDDEQVDIRISTSQLNFTFNRAIELELEEEETDGWFFLHLATATDGGRSFLSKKEGPARDFSGFDDDLDFMEGKQQIEVGDQELLKAYKTEVSNGASIRNYAGIWSLGLDILPQVGTSSFWFFTEQSECCELQSWYLHQTEQQLDYRPTKIPVLDSMRFFEGMIAKMRGQMNANENRIVITLTDILTQPEDTGIQKLELDIAKRGFQSSFKASIDMEDNPQPIPFNFEKGEKHFMIKVIFWKQKMTIDLNCKGAVNISYPEGEEFSFDTYYSFTMEGASQESHKKYLMEFPGNPSGKEVLKAWEYGDLGEGNGILFIGNASTYFKIRLWRASKDLILEWTKETRKKTVNFELFIRITKVSEWLGLRSTTAYDLWFDNEVQQSPDFDKELSPQVRYIQVLGDVMLEGNKPIITPKIPAFYPLEYELISKGTKFLVEGRLLNMNKPQLDMGVSNEEDVVDRGIRSAIFTLTIKEDSGIHVSVGKDESFLTTIEPGSNFTFEFHYVGNEKAYHLFFNDANFTVKSDSAVAKWMW